ncbi:hypothetical protein AVEN_233634-1 [Araneus ventricosus]|uniref:Uncharacterized protein n=1 Tax=Araneus ventricosus TaxID=182803 RepID=A0A4Y2JKE3_ARAVE|nr:hypothetical protein AVEN_233634-1 [Araneus ventricosus]
MDALYNPPGSQETAGNYPYRAIFGCLGRIMLENTSSHTDGEVTEYSDQEIDSETDVKDNPVHEECREPNSDPNVCIIDPFNL